MGKQWGGSRGFRGAGDKMVAFKGHDLSLRMITRSILSLNCCLTFHEHLTFLTSFKFSRVDLICGAIPENECKVSWNVWQFCDKAVVKLSFVWALFFLWFSLTLLSGNFYRCLFIAMMLEWVEFLTMYLHLVCMLSFIMRMYYSSQWYARFIMKVQLKNPYIISTKTTLIIKQATYCKTTYLNVNHNSIILSVLF